MTVYYSKYAGSTTAPGPTSSAGAVSPFRVKVNFADLRTATGATHTTGVVATDDIGIITLPAGAMLTSIGLYTETGQASGQVDLTDGTTTWISNGSIATDSTVDYPDTNPMAQVFYSADTLIYLNSDATTTTAVVWVFGSFYMAMDENDL